MDSTSTNVVLFAFRDADRAAHVVAVARRQSGVRSIALVGCLSDCEIRIVGGAGEGVTEARWLAVTLAVLDVLSGPFRMLAGSRREMDPVTLPDSDDGLATFGRLIPQGALVILAAVCEDDMLATETFDRQLGQALFQISADCAIRLSGHQAKVADGNANALRRLHSSSWRA
jgi:hypothetical protein